MHQLHFVMRHAVITYAVHISRISFQYIRSRHLDGFVKYFLSKRVLFPTWFHPPSIWVRVPLQCCRTDFYYWCVDVQFGINFLSGELWSFVIQSAPYFVFIEYDYNFLSAILLFNIPSIIKKNHWLKKSNVIRKQDNILNTLW